MFLELSSSLVLIYLGKVNLNLIFSCIMIEKGTSQCIVIAFFVGAVTLTTPGVLGDVTSLHDMVALAHQEIKLLNTVHDYINIQQEKIMLIRAKYEQIMKNWPSGQTTEEIVGDPIKAYTLVRRLTREWPLILNLMMNTADLREELFKLPAEDEMDNAIRALTRLQEVYKLDTKQLAQNPGNFHLTPMDCYEVGKYLFSGQNFKAASSWFEEALEINAIDKNPVGEDKLIPQLLLAKYLPGCYDGTRSGGDAAALQELLSEYPNYVLDRDTAPVFNLSLSTGCLGPNSVNATGNFSNDARLYSDTCRGIGLKSSSELKCFYINYNNPRLLMAPFKLEEKNIDPPIVMFHDVISDQEIEEMKVEFNKVKENCQVVIEGHNVKDYYRTCDVGWVVDNATKASARLTRRVGDMTNMNMETCEENQVASYGIGGEFLLHDDPIPDEALPEFENGSRIATLMFYLNDVESGGYTIFPLLNVAVKPEKGSAVFWFNLDHTSRCLDAALHGGCPVLKGSKWVLNKWIHEGKQNSEIFCPADMKFPKPRTYLSSIK